MINILFSDNGELTSLKYNKVEFAAKENDPQGLFILQFRDRIGNPLQFSCKDFADCSVSRKGNITELSYSKCKAVCDIAVKVTAEEKEDTVLWNIAIENNCPYIQTEWIDFPRLRLAKSAIENWILPFAEGTLIPDLAERDEKSAFKCKYTEYPMSGLNGFYPGPVAMQFEACYNSEVGLCIICQDRTHSPKTVDAHSDGADGNRLLLQHFTGGENKLAYDVAVTGFEGDWQDAAEIYRDWMEENDPYLPPKQADFMPQWLKDSPTFLVYPVKGHGLDLGDQQPNEYYPYVNALPVVEKYKKLFGGTFIAVLMHWEGTAPWAPPYIWPPYGGEDELKKFIDAMHSNGDKVGLYASGIAWTQYSMTDKTFDLTERFIKENVEKEICSGPRKEKYSKVCNGISGQRIGYDLCPSREFTRKIVREEISKAATLGVDYLQYFDQNQGAAAPLCYEKEHGHPEIPGAWATDDMRELLHQAVESGRGMVIGCENAAAQPYTDYCKLNDLRYQLAWEMGGIPVPLYPYLFHEYTAGFSGNGGCLSGWIDMEKTPEFLCWHLAWNFACGNFLTLVLKDGGQLHWHWALDWSKAEPDNEALCRLMSSFARRRRELSENYLACGRMLKAPEIICGKNKIYRKKFGVIEVPKIISAAWQGIDGKKIALLVNYNPQEEKCILNGSEITISAYDVAVIEV